MSAQALSAIQELMDMFDHALLHRDTSVCVRMSADQWQKFQATVGASDAAAAQVATEAAAASTVTPAPGGEVHVQFQAGDFHAMSEAHAQASAGPVGEGLILSEAKPDEGRVHQETSGADVHESASER